MTGAASSSATAASASPATGAGSPGSVLGLAPVIPVVVIDDAANAVPLARALAAGGLPAIEVTLRTPAAPEAIRAIAAEVPDAVVSAGTVLTPQDVRTSVATGARFLVSPGWTERLLGALQGSGLPFLPGVSSASEVLGLLEHGVREMKFFPAEAAGGAGYLRALSAPLPQARFCPTGRRGCAMSFSAGVRCRSAGAARRCRRRSTPRPTARPPRVPSGTGTPAEPRAPAGPAS